MNLKNIPDDYYIILSLIISMASMNIFAMMISDMYAIAYILTHKLKFRFNITGVKLWH